MLKHKKTDRGIVVLVLWRLHKQRGLWKRSLLTRTLKEKIVDTFESLTQFDSFHELGMNTYRQVKKPWGLVDYLLLLPIFPWLIDKTAQLSEKAPWWLFPIKTLASVVNVVLLTLVAMFLAIDLNKFISFISIVISAIITIIAIPFLYLFNKFTNWWGKSHMDHFLKIEDTGEFECQYYYDNRVNEEGSLSIDTAKEIIKKYDKYDLIDSKESKDNKDKVFLIGNRYVGKLFLVYRNEQGDWCTKRFPSDSKKINAYLSLIDNVFPDPVTISASSPEGKYLRNLGAHVHNSKRTWNERLKLSDYKSDFSNCYVRSASKIVINTNENDLLNEEEYNKRDDDTMIFCSKSVNNNLSWMRQKFFYFRLSTLTEEQIDALCFFGYANREEIYARLCKTSTAIEKILACASGKDYCLQVVALKNIEEGFYPTRNHLNGALVCNINIDKTGESFLLYQWKEDQNKDKYGHWEKLTSGAVSQLPKRVQKSIASNLYEYNGNFRLETTLLFEKNTKKKNDEITRFVEKYKRNEPKKNKTSSSQKEHDENSKKFKQRVDNNLLSIAVSIIPGYLSKGNHCSDLDKNKQSSNLRDISRKTNDDMEKKEIYSRKIMQLD